MKKLFFALIFGLMMISCCAPKQSTIKDNLLNVGENETFRVKKKIDLKGRSITLPQGVTLVSEGGRLCNGCIVGNKTKIKGTNPLFNHIAIKGTWEVKKISTGLFYDLTYDNSLLDVFALTSPVVNNEVLIEKGCYNVSITSSGGAAISVNSNTTIELNGDVILRPNTFDICYIMLVMNSENVKIHGNGSIIGDRSNHKGQTGEWGMGVHVVNSKNVVISGISIKDCWGDCIYIGKESSNIRINNCTIDNGRRQGISVTSANNVEIKNCKIKNISGTPPEYAIDIEPNKGQRVNKVRVSNVDILDCSGGLRIYGNARGAKVTNVSFNKCTIEGKVKQIPISLSCAEDVSVNLCKADVATSTALYMENVDEVLIYNSILSATDEIIIRKKCGDIIEKDNQLSIIKK